MTDRKPDGGYAFPTPIAVGPAGDLYAVTQAEFGVWGMTLRDWFAAHSLEAVMRAASQPVTNSGAIARAAYIIADAMLKERNIT